MNYWLRQFSLLILLLFFAPVALGHSVQEEPSQIVIRPRLNYLTIRITGAAIDWHDAASRNPHGADPGAKATANENALAANYALSHLVLEQGGQVLPLHVQRLVWRKLRENDDSSERFEIFLRANRPAHLAAAPLSVGSDLFSNLEKAASIVELGGVAKEVRGAETAEFPGAMTVPSFAGDMQRFAYAGLMQPVSSAYSIIMLGVLLLGLTLLPVRYLFPALGTMILGQSCTFLVDLMGASASLAAGVGIVSVSVVAILASVAFINARRPGVPTKAVAVTVVTASVGGAALGFSGVGPLRIWGLPETGLLASGFAFVLGAAVAQAVVALLLWTLLLRCKRKFAHQAQYGGMGWPQVVKIAAVVLGLLGGYCGLQFVA